MTVALVLAGGALGSLMRYGLSGFAQRFSGGIFPWGTLTVNLLGAFAIGLTYEVLNRSAAWPGLRIFLFSGILGGFTTFSAFGLETSNLLRNGEARLGVANVLFSAMAGVILVFAGFAAGKLLLRLVLK